MCVGTQWSFINLQLFLSVQEHSRALGEDFKKTKTNPQNTQQTKIVFYLHFRSLNLVSGLLF